MKTQIRRGVFETNSSSTHGISITNHVAILTDKEYKDYQMMSISKRKREEEDKQRLHREEKVFRL